MGYSRYSCQQQVIEEWSDAPQRDYYASIDQHASTKRHRIVDKKKATIERLRVYSGWYRSRSIASSSNERTHSTHIELIITETDAHQRHTTLHKRASPQGDVREPTHSSKARRRIHCGRPPDPPKQPTEAWQQTCTARP